MSTNPFRQIRPQQDQPSGTISPPSDSQPPASATDGSGAGTADLFLDTKVLNPLDRHVSFASPPVDSTIPAASYPSSPESTRFSPPFQYAQPVTFNDRPAFHNDPFGSLGRDGRQDQTIQQALSNAQYNTTPTQNEATRLNAYTAHGTLNRFASAPRPAQQLSELSSGQSSQASKQSLDVEAFKRLLLTGDSSQTTPGASTPPVSRNSDHSPGANSASTETVPLSQQSKNDTNSSGAKDLLASLHGQEPRDTDKTKVPPPAPAPRRGKSVKVNVDPSWQDERLGTNTDIADVQVRSHDKKRPPTPPLARRQSQRTSQKNEELVEPLRKPGSPGEPLHASQKVPPLPPPIRRQSSLSQRRPSGDLAPTIEESESDPAASIGSRRSSADRPPPLPSRTSSTSAKRQSLAPINPPPIPPPRKGRGSSRSSTDSFRPSLASIMGGEGAQENLAADGGSRRSSTNEHGDLTPSNANNILTELANLRKEVDAARRGA